MDTTAGVFDRSVMAAQQNRYLKPFVLVFLLLGYLILLLRDMVLAYYRLVHRVTMLEYMVPLAKRYPILKPLVFLRIGLAYILVSILDGIFYVIQASRRALYRVVPRVVVYRLTAALLVLMMLAQIAPLPVIATSQNTTVVVFSALPANVQAQTVTAGTGQSALNLPTQLDVFAEGGTAHTVSQVSWQCPNFDSATPGVYLFQPVLPAGYTLDAETVLPQIVVTVKATATTPDLIESTPVETIAPETPAPIVAEEALPEEVATPVEETLPEVSGEETAPVTVEFTDISGHWAEQTVRQMAGAGVVAGEGNTYRPNDTISAADYAKMLMNGLNLDPAALPQQFSLSGLSSQSHEPITRQDAIAFAVQIAQSRSLEAVMPKQERWLSNFNDSDEIDLAVWDDLQYAFEYGIINGTTDQKAMPRKQLTRAEAITMVYNLLHQSDMI